MGRKLIAANWKENPRSEAAAVKLFDAMRGEDTVICPPFIYLEAIAAAKKKMGRTAGAKIALGAQDAFWQERGAFTGEVGPEMLKRLGVRYVILGHSEKRRFEGETDAMINKKVRQAQADGLRVILCVGEDAEVRKKGVAASRRHVGGQLKKDLQGMKGSVIVAYEPIWAIGSGNSDKPEDAREMALFIKKFSKETCGVRAKVLYGGSVDGKNAANYLSLKEIDGALVGGASLRPAEFRKVLQKAK